VAGNVFFPGTPDGSNSFSLPVWKARAIPDPRPVLALVEFAQTYKYSAQLRGQPLEALRHILFNRLIGRPYFSFGKIRVQVHDPLIQQSLLADVYLGPEKTLVRMDGYLPIATGAYYFNMIHTSRIEVEVIRF
jgi:hypothetical protein